MCVCWFVVGCFDDGYVCVVMWVMVDWGVNGGFFWCFVLYECEISMFDGMCL